MGRSFLTFWDCHQKLNQNEIIPKHNHFVVISTNTKPRVTRTTSGFFGHLLGAFLGSRSALFMENSQWGHERCFFCSTSFGERFWIHSGGCFSPVQEPFRNRFWNGPEPETPKISGVSEPYRNGFETVPFQNSHKRKKVMPPSNCFFTFPTLGDLAFFFWYIFLSNLRPSLNHI